MEIRVEVNDVLMPWLLVVSSLDRDGDQRRLILGECTCKSMLLLVTVANVK